MILALAEIILLFGMFLFGCAGNSVTAIPETHPANPAVPEAPAASATGVLIIHLPVPDPIPPEMKGKQMEMHH